MVRSWLLSLVIAAVVGVFGGVGGGIGGTGVASACECVSSIGEATVERSSVASFGVPATPDTTPTTVAPGVQAEEDRTAGYVVMVGAVLAFVIGFAVLAVRFRKRSHSLGR